MTDPLEILASTVDRGAVEGEIAQLDAEIQERAARMNKLRLLLSLLPENSDAQSGEVRARAVTGGAGTVNGIRPSLADALVLVMQGREPSTVWTGDELLVALQRKGWQPGGKTPRNSVDATLSRLRKAGKVERVGSGVYKLTSASADGARAAGNSAATLLEGMEGG